MKWLRLLVRVLLAAAALLVLAALIVLGPLREWTADLARRGAERELGAALQAPVTIGALRVTLLPPRVEADTVVLGPDGSLARAGHVAVRLLPRTSLRQLRPVVEAAVEDVFVDVPRWAALLERAQPGPPAALPPFRLRALHVSRVNLRLSPEPEPLDLALGAVRGMLKASALGRLRFGADARELLLSRRGAVLPLEHARLRGGEAADGWRLTALEVAGDGIELVSGAAGSDRLPVRGRVALRRLAFASDVFERMGGDAEIDAALIGSLETPAAGGTVRVADWTVDGEPIGDVSVTAEWNRQRLAVSSARLHALGGDAEASGDLAMAAPFAYGARLRWASLDGRRVARLSPQAIKPFTASGTAELSGTLEPPTVRADGTGTFSGAAGATPIEWRGSGSYRAGAGSGEIDATQADANTLRANLDIAAGGALSGSLAAAVANPTALGAFLPIESAPSVSGALSASAEVSGRLDDPHLSGQLTGRNLALLGMRIDRLGGAFTLDRTALHTPGISAELWQGSVTGSGAVAFDALGDNDWRIRAVDIPGDALVAVVQGLTGSLPPIGRGTLAVEVSGRGPWPRVQIDGRATLAQFWLGREWIERAAVDGSASWPRWQVTGELRNRAGQTLALRGSGAVLDDVTLDAHSAGWELTAQRRGELTETGGTLTLDAALRGPPRALSGHAALRARELVLGGRRVGGVDIDATAAGGRWQVTASLLDGAARLRGQLTPDPGWPFAVDGEWSATNYAPLFGGGADLRIVSAGTLQLVGRLAALDQLDATVRLQSLGLEHGPYGLATERPALLACRRGACVLDELALRGPDTELRARATFTSSGAVHVTLTGEGDLRVLELSSAVESARGRFAVDAEIRRDGGRWDLSGQMTVADAGLDVGAPVVITRANGRLTLAGTTVRVDQLAGRMGTGDFAIGGALDLSHGPDLTWTLTNVGTELMPSLEVELSGRGVLDGSWERMRVSGEIDITRLLYDRNVELSDFLPRLNRALAPPPPRPGARTVDLDLHVVAPGDLYVENNVARIEGRADLRITGTAARPLLEGRIEALDGTVTFRDRTFDLESATIDFRPDLGLVAALNISAESTIETPDATYLVDIRVTGTTAEPRVALTSDDPSLSQTDIATLIAVGKTTAQLREGGGEFTIDALALMPGPVSQGLQRGTKQILPIDRVSFESTYSRTTGAFEPQIKLGKDLTDSLAVSVAQTFGVESRTTVLADYRLSQRVFLQTSWESETSTQAGAFAGGVKVRYEFWRVTPFTLLGGLR